MLHEPIDAPPPVEQSPPTRRFRIPVKRLVQAAVLLFVLIVGWLVVTAPLSRSLKPIAPPSVTLVAADGSVVARRGAIVAAPVDVGRLPDHVGNAFLAIEDRRFYSHWGIDPRGIARAAWHNARAGGVREGGSTITQQLAKMVFLSNGRTAGRKAREMLIAFWLEAWLTKRDILSRYLSDAYFGDNVYGLRAAARHYFDVTPEALSVGQSAMLAGLMKAPSRLAPSTNLAGARTRQALVVRAMVDAGMLSQARAARVRPAVTHIRTIGEAPTGTYFADWVLPAARNTDGDGYAERTVATTLEPARQREAEAAVRQAGSAQVALVSLRTDGRVIAMVGGRRYADSPFNRATQARRQPGSTFKLFVYLAALRAGMTPDDMIEDSPVTIDGWSPANADRTYRGRITLREAFARSSNVAAVRLAQRVGPREVVRAARDLGITAPLAADPSIALGTSGVSLIELAGAYAAVAAGTYPVRARGLPLDASGWDRGWIAKLWDRPHPIPARQHAMLLDLLSATVNTGTARGAALDTQVYGKTGTTQGNRDAIFVGFARGIVTAVWVGRDDNTPVKGMAGGGLPARIWRGYMAQAIGAHIPHRAVPRSVDPDAFDLDLGDLGLGDLPQGNIAIGDIGVRLDGDGLHVSGLPHDAPPEPDEPPPPEPDEPQ